MSQATRTLDQKQNDLLARMRRLHSCAVAMSGGVDSVLVAKAAQLALGDNALAVTGVSASLAEGELDQAQAAARQIGIRHEVLETQEFLSPSYVRNDRDRCYHCKSELYLRIDAIKQRFGVRHVANGANADDLGDYRPGMKAAAEHEVVSPLIDCNLNKSDVRELAAAWDLPVWDKPASPCLSSRVAYGEEVTPERLRRIDRAEQLLRSLGLRETRVRLHRGELARLEIPLSELPRFAAEPLRSQLVSELKSLGFAYVTVDLEGFRSGSLNLVEIEGSV